MPKSIVALVKTTLVELGVVQTEAEFCHDWLGRGQGYLRTLRFTKTTPSPAALAFCADRLGRLACHLAEHSGANGAIWAKHFDELAQQCRREMELRLLERVSRSERSAARFSAVEYLSSQYGSSAAPVAAGRE